MAPADGVLDVRQPLPFLHRVENGLVPALDAEGNVPAPRFLHPLQDLGGDVVGPAQTGPGDVDLLADDPGAECLHATARRDKGVVLDQDFLDPELGPQLPDEFDRPGRAVCTDPVAEDGAVAEQATVRAATGQNDGGAGGSPDPRGGGVIGLRKAAEQVPGGQRQLIEVPDERPPRMHDDLVVFPDRRSRQSLRYARARFRRSNHLPEGLFSLSDHGHVEALELGQGLLRQCRDVATADDHEGIGQRLLDPRRELTGCGDPYRRGTDADKARLRARDLLEACLDGQVLRCGIDHPDVRPLLFGDGSKAHQREGRLRIACGGILPVAGFQGYGG